MRVVLLFGVLVLALVLVNMLFSIANGTTVSSKPAPQPKETKADKSINIARRQALCSKVDSFIIEKDAQGEKAPIRLIEARVAIEDAPNDEILAYAYAHLEKEWEMAMPGNGNSPKRLEK